MDRVGDLSRDEAKRQRLDGFPDLHSDPRVETAGNPNILSPAAYGHAFPQPMSHQDVSAPWLYAYSPAQHLGIVNFEHQRNDSIPFNLHAPPNSLISQPYEALGFGDAGSYETQFVANGNPYALPDSAPWANPLPVQLPMSSLGLPFLHQASGQFPQAEPSMLVQPPYQPYLAGSPQPPVILEQSSGSVFTATYGDTVGSFPGPAIQQPNIYQGVTVCFGMILGVSGRCERPSSEKFSPVYEVQLTSSESFSAMDDPRMTGTITSNHGQMIQGLFGDPVLSLHASCTLYGEPSTRQASSGSFEQLSCALDITVYGPWEQFDQVGMWLKKHGVYLQDPRVCHMDVKYCNPHRVSSNDFESCPQLSEVVSSTNPPSQLQDITKGPELLDILSNNVDLPETPQPKAIRTTLHTHQKKALTFLIRREKGWAFDTCQSDIWEKFDTDQGRFFVNRISSAVQVEEPPQFYGGIVADPMGLGKTLTMIALAATDLDARANGEDYIVIGKGASNAVSSTLIIVPPSLLGIWKEQLIEHILAGSLEWRCHYGKGRILHKSELDLVDVVLTTYHTVSSEWKNGNSILFSTRWRRIILDEAHYIRNGNSRMANATCALDSVSRWAVTGTPIQNRLGDLASLLKFIRAHPYDDPKVFDADISRLWKSGGDEEAARRLKQLSACLLLRRPKSTITLPQRRDLRWPVDFSDGERILYDEIREQAVSKIEEALQNGSEAPRAGSYANVLQHIDSLRLVCALGLQYRTRHRGIQHLTTEDTDWAGVDQETHNVQQGMWPVVYAQSSEVPAHTGPEFSDYGHKPPGPTGPTPMMSTSVIGGVSSAIPPQIEAPSTELPSKVKALVADIKSLPPGTKCVVFSTWRLTLDIVKAGLDQASLQSIRFDGRVPQKDRQYVIEKFKADPNIRVMLLTLSCGAVGLTLTVASRAYLMEPHWNPTIEEQALARIHRIGQMQEVTTVRFYMRDSFEEQVMEMQESKNNLAGVLLSPHDGESMDDSLGNLKRLRLLL